MDRTPGTEGGSTSRATRDGARRDASSGTAALVALPLCAVASVIAIGGLTAGSVFLSLSSSGPAGTTLAASSPRVTSTGPVPTATTIAVLAGGYLLACFAGTFFSAALVATADERTRTGAASVSHGLRVASLRAPQLLLWSIIAGTVGVVARQFGHRGVIGIMLGRMTPRGWHVTTAWVLPMIVTGDAGVAHALRASRRLAREATDAAGPTATAPTSDLPGAGVPATIIGGLFLVATLWPFAPTAAVTLAVIGAIAVYVACATSTGLARSAGYRTLAAG